jgi:hypothetical protein
MSIAASSGSGAARAWATPRWGEVRPPLDTRGTWKSGIITEWQQLHEASAIVDELEWGPERGPAVDAWQAWTPADVAARLSEVGVPWCVVGGWAIDLFVGSETRPHSDLEIAVAREDFVAVRRTLAGCRFYAAKNGRTLPLPPDTEPPDGIHQIWVLDPTARAWRMDVMLEPGDAATWRFRREPSINAPRTDMVGTTPGGIPYLRPQGTLLYKATGRRAKDQHDFDLAVPRMDLASRQWLATALIVYLRRPHPWTDVLV